MFGRIKLLLVIAIISSLQAQTLVPEGIEMFNDNLNLKLDFQKRCHAGDLDLIYMELLTDLAERERAIISIEPLGSDKEGSFSIINTGSTENTPILEILQHEANLDLTSFRDYTGLVGIFICKDGDADGRCRNNKIEDFTTTMSSYIIPTSKINKTDGKIEGYPKPRQKKDDKVYYFRPAIVKDNKILVYPSAENEQSYTEIMESNGIEDSKALDFVTKTSKSLASLIESKYGNSLVLPIPYYDQEGCYGSNKQ